MAKLKLNGNLDAGLETMEEQRRKQAAKEIHSINPARRRELAHHEPTGELAAEFICPPFSVLDGRQGWWLNRKRAWIALGVRGEEGRDAKAYNIGNKEDFDESVAGRKGYGLAARNNAELDERTQRALGVYASANGATTKRGRGGKKRHATRAPGAGNTGGKGAYIGADGKHYDPKYADKTMSGNICSDDYDRSSQSVTGASVFDPVLVELVYRWFAPVGGLVFDPFGGESTKGLIASYLGYEYCGVEIRPEQVKANDRQAKAMGVTPRWVVGDSAKIEQNKQLRNVEADLVFTSPPYYDLEVYSENEDDGSTFPTYEAFMEWYGDIFRQTVAKMKNNRFLVVKVGEIRNAAGSYHNFVGDNVSLFMDLGLEYYNEIILLTSIGSLPVRTGNQFRGSRKVGKTHQNVLVFWKGRLDAIPSAICKPVTVQQTPKSTRGTRTRKKKPIRRRGGV